MPLLRYDDLKPEDLDTEGEDHIADETRYFCMARPISPRQNGRTPIPLPALDINDLGKNTVYPRMEIIA